MNADAALERILGIVGVWPEVSERLWNGAPTW